MKLITIRKRDCGHWVITLCFKYNDIIYFDQEHFESFGDCLVAINLEAQFNA